MLFRNQEKSKLHDGLLEESRKLLERIRAKEILTIMQVPPNASEETRELVSNINEALEEAKKLAVETTEQRFHLVTSVIQGGYWEIVPVDGDPFHPDIQFTWSEGLMRALGYAEGELENSSEALRNHLHPEEMERVFEIFIRHVSDPTGQTPYNMVHRMRTKSGEYRWFHANAITHRDEQGRPLRIIGGLFDIHEQKLKEEELQSYVTRYDLVNQVLVEAPWDMTILGEDVNNNPVWFSPQFRRALGFEDENDFPNRFESFEQRLHPEDKDRMLQTFAASLNDYTGNTPFDMEYRLQLKSGEYRWFRGSGTALRDENGVPLRIAGTIRDITHEKNKENLVKMATEKMAQLSQSIQEIVQGIESLAAHAQELAATQEQSAMAAKKASDSADETQSISDMIRGFAGQTHLLGLNASIEAARAGEHGRGFGVVAEEVRKLAASSAEATEHIDNSLEEMKQLMQGILELIDRMSAMTQTQAALTEQLSASIEEVDEMSRDLVEFARSI